MPVNIKEPPAHYHGSIIEWKALSKESRYSLKNKDAKQAYNRAYLAANKDAVKAYNQTYYTSNKDAVKAHSRAWHEANKDKKKVANAAYRQLNKDKQKVANAAYRQLNRDKILEQRRNKTIEKANDFYELFGTWEIEPGIY